MPRSTLREAVLTWLAIASAVAAGGLVERLVWWYLLGTVIP
jgi:hypothetical protein